MAITKTGKRKYSTEDKEHALKAISSLPEVPERPSNLTARDIIHDAKPEITKRIAAGYSYEEILKALQAAGVDISMTTFKAYMKPAKKQSGTKARRATRTSGEAVEKRDTMPQEVKCPVYSNNPDDK